MITKNPMQLKAIIKKKAAEKHVPEQLVMQNYMLERLLKNYVNEIPKKLYSKGRLFNRRNCWTGHKNNNGSGCHDKRA